MKRFVGNMEQSGSSLPPEYTAEFAPIFTNGRQVVGSVSETLQETNHFFHTTLPTLQSNWGINNVSSVEMSTCFARGVLTDSERNALEQLFSQLYSVPLSDVHSNSTFYKFKDLTLNGKRLGSWQSRSSNSSILTASWYPSFFGCDGSRDTRPVRVNYFAKHVVTIQATPITHLLFSPSWFKAHPERMHYGKPISIWQCDIFEEGACTSLLPIQLIEARTVSLIDKLSIGVNDTVLIVCPCLD